LRVADHLRATHTAKRAERSHQVNGFENVGFALRIVPEQEVEAGRKIGVHPHVIAKVAESEMRQMHAPSMWRNATGREIFSLSSKCSPPFCRIDILKIAAKVSLSAGPLAIDSAL
jgi:hypothetical protein